METQKREKKKKKKKISDDLRSTDPIPHDLIPEILKASTVETLARFRCVSTQYASLIRSRDFMKSYLNKSSSTRPKSLMFTFESKPHGKHFFFSAIQPPQQNRGESSSSSSSVAVYHMKCHSQPYITVAPSVHGLICYGPPCKLNVYNPSIRRYMTLPKIDSLRIDMYHYLGYDPSSGDYKVLCMTKGNPVGRRRGLAQELRVLTMGRNGNSWRMIEDFPPHSPDSHEISIDGVLYYGAFLDIDPSYLGMYQAVMSFDVSSEKFHLIEIPETAIFTKLTSYKGKLALIHSPPSTRPHTVRIESWVLLDAKTHEWSKRVFDVDLPGAELVFRVFCLTDVGEFVLAQKSLSAERFYVVYYDPKKNSVRRVYIEGIKELNLPLWDKDSNRCTISIFPGQVENLMFL
ncbi:PREDICTED: F-box protein At2g21930-like [Camelina sativa]|uniref:F-box protein At2g21930-like n=1 Tax=Camelina sativa TaxID=90675 RepID=A0ABM0TNY3_CAMSA|nr:PREDICTED: F-box protein At2g21930-like [Camelina sativa]